ncbi:MAG: recombinase A [Candidatus Zixiibacteriota bacterium]|nr:MAG: recombinase A [candidate division Zixibacteria bacterium]
MNEYPLIDLATPLARSPQTKDPWLRLAGRDLRRELTATATPAAWSLSTFAGRFGEISADHATASLTLVFRLVLEAQKQGEPVGWISGRGSTFFPPDASDVGIDLSALAVIWAPETLAAARAAEHLLRSGSFGLVIMDLGPKARLPLHAHARLVGQARQHSTALLCITEKESNRPSVSSLVSLRAHTGRTAKKEDRFRCEARILKDKRSGPGWGHVEICRGPDGLR